MWTRVQQQGRVIGQTARRVAPGVDLLRSLLADRATASLEERRAGLDTLGALVPVVEGTTVVSTTLAGRPAERLTPAVVEGPGVVLYLHGGAFISGSLVSHRGLASRLAAAAGRQVVTLDYRLGPEHPFPAAVDDAVAAVRELRAELAAEAGVGSGAAGAGVAVAGDSAGGGLAVAVLVALHAAGEAQPTAAVAISPWVDLTQSGGSYQTRDEADPTLDRATLQDAADLYLAGAAPEDPLASPMLAPPSVLAALAPLMVQVGDAEVLLDDSVSLARGIAAAGGDVEITVVPEMIHVFPAYPYDLIPEAEVAVSAMGAFLARHLS